MSKTRKPGDKVYFCLNRNVRVLALAGEVVAPGIIREVIETKRLWKSEAEKVETIYSVSNKEFNVSEFYPRDIYSTKEQAEKAAIKMLEEEIVEKEAEIAYALALISEIKK